MFWLRVWNADNFEIVTTDSSAIDTGHLNRGLLSEFVFETLPQLVLQIFNNTNTKIWTTSGYFSTCFSIFSTLNGIYKYIYWVGYKGISIDDVPVTVNITFLGQTILGVKVAENKEVVASETFDNEKPVPQEVNFSSAELDKVEAFLLSLVLKSYSNKNTQFQTLMEIIDTVKSSQEALLAFRTDKAALQKLFGAIDMIDFKQLMVMIKLDENFIIDESEITMENDEQMPDISCKTSQHEIALDF